jgi:hypothetical protein
LRLQSWTGAELEQRRKGGAQKSRDRPAIATRDNDALALDRPTLKHGASGSLSNLLRDA